MKVEKALLEIIKNSIAVNELITEFKNKNMNKINVEVKTKEQRDQLIKQLEGMTFERVLPKTWEEYLEILPFIDRGIHKSRVETLCSLGFYNFANQYKLERLIRYYNDGWTPDYDKGGYKYIIYCEINELSRYSVNFEHHFFTFKTQQLRDKFLNNFEEMIKKHYNIE